jgi:sigma-E processing peptidase SpoIIGA
MALGGFMTALFHLLNRSPLAEGIETVEGDGISVWIFALLALISAAITLLGGRFFAGRTAQRTAEVRVYYRGRSARLRAMVDNGNLLREPMSGKPCIVVNTRALTSVLPPELLRVAPQGAVAVMASVSDEYVKDLRLIPTYTAVGEGMLLGIRMERIILECGKSQREVDAVVALSALESSAGGNEALLPAQLLVS